MSCSNTDVTVYVTVDNGWVGYIAASLVPAANAAFVANFADGIPANSPLVITDCE